MARRKHHHRSQPLGQGNAKHFSCWWKGATGQWMINGKAVSEFFLDCSVKTGYWHLLSETDSCSNCSKIKCCFACPPLTIFFLHHGLVVVEVGYEWFCGICCLSRIDCKMAEGRWARYPGGEWWGEWFYRYSHTAVIRTNRTLYYTTREEDTRSRQENQQVSMPHLDNFMY